MFAYLLSIAFQPSQHLQAPAPIYLEDAGDVSGKGNNSEKCMNVPSPVDQKLFGNINRKRYFSDCSQLP